MTTRDTHQTPSDLPEWPGEPWGGEEEMVALRHAVGVLLSWCQEGADGAPKKESPAGRAQEHGAGE